MKQRIKLTESELINLIKRTIEEQVTSNQQDINKKLPHDKGFDKYPCVLSMPGYDFNKDGIIEVFGSPTDAQYYPDGTYMFNNKKGKYSCQGNKVVQVGYSQKFKPYTDPKNPFITTGANKDYIQKGSRDAQGANWILNLQKKLYNLGYLKSSKYLTGNLGEYTMKAVENLTNKYNASLFTPLGVYKDTYDKIINGKLK